MAKVRPEAARASAAFFSVFYGAAAGRQMSNVVQAVW
jgi:hypothetical protein